jgi:iron complex outermembrane receptor protein
MRRHSSFIQGSTILFVAAGLAATAFASAQDAPQGESDGIEEVVVTAQKRSESVQDVPIAITAFSAEKLAQSGIASSDELQKFTPNLTWNAAGGAGASVGMRGIVDINFTTGQVGSVGIVVDEVGLNSPVANTFSLLDLERVEVLRGPQVTLYGRSTTGGAINFITRRPQVGGDFEGNVAATFGRFNQIDVEGAFGMPLGERAALRVAALSTSRDGIFENPTLGTEDSNRERRVARVSLGANLSEDLVLYTSLHTGEQRGQSLRYKNIGYGLASDPGVSCGQPLRVGNGCADLSGFVDSADFDLNFSNFPRPVENVDAGGGLVNLTWTPGAYAFTSITAFEENSLERSEDTDGGPANLLDVSIVADTEQFSQEFRVASDSARALRWIGGVFYLRERQDGITTVALRDFDVFIATAYEQTNTIYSGYAQVDYEFDDRWSLSIGGRYSKESKEGLGTGYAAFDDLAGRGIPPLGALIDRDAAARFGDATLTAPVPFDQSWSNFGGKVGLNFKPSEDVLVYGSVSRGFKGGAINLAAGPLLADPLQAEAFAQGVEPEELTTFEVGAKTRFLDGRMQLNLALFRNDYTDQQLFIVRDGLAFLYNAAESTINGVEVEWQWVPAAGLTFSAGIGFLDAKYDTLLTDAGDFSGNEMLQTPEFNGTFAVRKEWPLAAGSIAAEVSASHVTKQYFDLPNALSTGSRTTADARVDWKIGAEEKFRLGIWGKNLGDERFCTNAADLGVQAAQCIVNEPRTFGVTVSAQF